MNARLTTMMAVPIVVGLALVGVIGCGGSGDSTSATGSASSNASGESDGGTGDETSPVDEATFVKQASKACKKAREGGFERVGAYEQQHESDGLPPAVLAEKAIKVVLFGTIRKEIEGIEEAGPLEGQEKEIETLISEMQAIFDRAKGNSEISPTEIEEVFRPTDKTLRKYELVACSKSE